MCDQRAFRRTGRLRVAGSESLRTLLAHYYSAGERRISGANRQKVVAKRYSALAVALCTLVLTNALLANVRCFAIANRKSANSDCAARNCHFLNVRAMKVCVFSKIAETCFRDMAEHHLVPTFRGIKCPVSLWSVVTCRSGFGASMAPS